MRKSILPPIVSSEAQNQRGTIFRTVARLTMLVASVFLTALTLVEPAIAPQDMVYLIIVNLLGIVLLEINRRGRSQLASALLVGGLIVLVTVMSPAAGGIRSPCVTMYFALSLMAGLLLGERAGVFTALICASLGLGLVGLDEYGFLPPQTVFYNNAALWLSNCTYMGIVIILLRLSTRTVGNALRRAETELTERRRVERQLELALEEAQSVARAKASFFAAMSHELRTPLNAIIGFSEMLAGEIFGPLGHPRNSEYVRDINYSGRRLLSLVNDVLDISRMDAGKMELREEILSIPEIIANVTRALEPLALKAGVRMVKTVAPGLPEILADGQRIEQVIANLLSNSVKFTPKGGRIEISACFHAGGLRISVADNGIGIRRDDIPKVFERFVQVDSSLARKYEGTGLGLPISKQLVELHGGTLTLESELHEGTVANISLPASRFAKGLTLATA